mgnify:CR=1 FL=1
MPSLSRFHVLDVFGIPIYVNVSFVFLLFLFVIDMHSFTLGVGCALVLAISIALHELAHAMTARLFGFRTKDITLSLLGGCASLIALPRKGWQEFLTALAGPLMSFAISGAVLLLDVFHISVSNEWLREILIYAFAMNLILGVFNLLPGFPMDGGRIFRSAMMLFLSRPKATLVAMWIGRVFAVLLGLSGAYALLNGGSWAFIRIFIAWMIWKDGYREYQLALMESGWEYHDFRAKVSPPPYDK